MEPTRHVPFTLAIGSESYFLARPASPVSGETRPPVDDNPLSPQTSVQLAILANALGSTGDPLTAGFGANLAGETGVVGFAGPGGQPPDTMPGRAATAAPAAVLRYVYS